LINTSNPTNESIKESKPNSNTNNANTNANNNNINNNNNNNTQLNLNINLSDIARSRSPAKIDIQRNNIEVINIKLTSDENSSQKFNK